MKEILYRKGVKCKREAQKQLNLCEWNVSMTIVPFASYRLYFSHLNNAIKRSAKVSKLRQGCH